VTTSPHLGPRVPGAATESALPGSGVAPFAGAGIPARDADGAVSALVSGDVAPAPGDLVSALALHGGRPALVGASAPGGVVTYAELAERVAAEAQHHRAQGLGTRRLVLLEARRDEAGVVALLGALAAHQPVLLTGPEATARLAEAWDPDVVVDAGGRTTRRARGTRDLHPDLALLLSTSGTTGSPKLVRLSRDNLVVNARQIRESLGIRADDVAATTLPLHYCYGLSVLTSHLAAGAAVLLTEESVTSDAFWEEARTHGVTTFPGVPHTFDLLERSGLEQRDLPSLRYVTQAGGRMDPATVRRVAALGARKGFDLVVMYGATEATARMAVLPPSRTATAPGSIGRAVPGGSFRLEPVPDADPGVGELVYTGPNVMLGYATDRADLARGRTVTELRTGDLARVRDDGLLEVTGRVGRIAKVLGLRLDLDRVERLLAARGRVVTAVDGGDRLVLGVVTASRPVVAREVQDHAADVLGLPPTSVAVVALPELPRLPSGKVDGRALAALADETVAAPAGGSVVDVDALCALVAEVLRRPVGPGDSFVSLGGDSLSYVEVSLRLERALGTLPSGWATRSMRSLAGESAVEPRRGRLVETNVLLRAFAIVSIVGSHANLFTLLGGAHLLLAVAGFNTARFHLADVPRTSRVRRLAVGALRIAVPSALVITTVSLWTQEIGWRQMLLVNGLTSTQWSEPHWYYWFVEAIVYILLVLAALLALPLVDRLERRFPFWLPFGLAVGALLTRYGVIAFPGDQIHRAHVVFWLFALGWAALRARAGWQRWLLTALAVVSVPGFFDEGERNLYVLVGLLALVWLPDLRVPTPVARVAGELASASLWIYLVHWQVYPHLEHRIPWLATVLSLLAGVLVARVVAAAGPRLRTAAGIDGAPGWLSPGWKRFSSKGTDGDARLGPGTPGRHDQPPHLTAGPARHR
jgi:acyl-CoA synthetase (AMP-forming)/AMP-acid ligase II